MSDNCHTSGCLHPQGHWGECSDKLEDVKIKDSELITQRRQVYGDPEETFIRIAQVWSGIIGHHINPVEVPLMMEGMKLVRTQVCPDYSDNSDDIVGYNDIFKLLVGEDMIHARSVDEYIAIKRERQMGRST